MKARGESSKLRDSWIGLSLQYVLGTKTYVLAILANGSTNAQLLGQTSLLVARVASYHRSLSCRCHSVITRYVEFHQKSIHCLLLRIFSKAEGKASEPVSLVYAGKP